MSIRGAATSRPSHLQIAVYVKRESRAFVSAPDVFVAELSRPPVRRPPSLRSSKHVPHDRSAPAPILTGLKGLCPRCGKGHVFTGFLTLRPNCEVCGLDLSFADTGDGPKFDLGGPQLECLLQIHPELGGGSERAR